MRDENAKKILNLLRDGYKRNSISESKRAKQGGYDLFGDIVGAETTSYARQSLRTDRVGGVNSKMAEDSINLGGAEQGEGESNVNTRGMGGNLESPRTKGEEVGENNEPARQVEANNDSRGWLEENLRGGQEFRQMAGEVRYGGQPFGDVWGGGNNG